MPDLQAPLDEKLHTLTMVHIAKLEQYVPGPVRKSGGAKADLIARYKADPVFSIWGLDSSEYAAATLGGGTITSIHRKLGDIYQDAVKTILMTTLGQTAEQIAYSAVIVSGTTEETRSADVYVQFDRLEREARNRVSSWCKAELRKLTGKPKLKLVGVGMEVRHCYQTGDSKRTQADEAMARHLLVSGILPVMPLFCNQSNPTVIERYRSVWIVKQGMESYELVKLFSGYDYFDFLKRNRDDFRQPIIKILRSLVE